MADYSEQLDAIARGPKSATHADGRSVTTQDVDAIIKVEDREQVKASRSKNHVGLTFRKIQPGRGGL